MLKFIMVPTSWCISSGEHIMIEVSCSVHCKSNMAAQKLEQTTPPPQT